MQNLRYLAMSGDTPAGLIEIVARSMSIPPTRFVQQHERPGIHTIVYVTCTPYTQTVWRETIDMLASNASKYFIANHPDDALDIIESRI